MTSDRILSLVAEAGATARDVPRKRGFTSICRASCSSFSRSSDDELVDIPEVLNSRETLEFCGLTARTATVAAVPPRLERRTMLFKGDAMTKLVSVFESDGSLQLRHLWSSSPTDFHHDSRILLYFTKHADVAELYARFAMRRVPPEEGVVLQFAIPSDLLEDRREIVGSDWQQLVSWSREPPSDDTFSVPSHLTQFTDALY